MLRMEATATVAWTPWRALSPRWRLERGTTLKLSRRTCSPRYGRYNHGEGNRRASRNGSSPESLFVRFATFPSL